MKISEVFHGENLKAEDLRGKEVVVTIAGWALMDFDDGKKIQLRFDESDRTLIVNKTNATTISELFGSDDTDDWTGGRICLFVDKTDFNGRRVDCIRVKEAAQPKGVVPARKIDENDANAVPF